jgi:predicted negative regulator of RcsB-dependent stress response
MNRNLLYVVIVVVAAAAVVFGYLFYQERQKAAGIKIDVGEGGISIETK